jgi:hypothetical protein
LMRPIRGVCCSDTLVTFTEERALVISIFLMAFPPLPWGAYQRTHKSDPCDCLLTIVALAGSVGRRTARVVLGIYIRES